ncbi:MAG: HI0074 family nucleotidyltransferase substrate-binding subunit [Vampirovibrionales bacterium]
MTYLLNYHKFQQTLKRLEIRYHEYLEHQKELPLYLLEAMRESCIQRFEVCFDTLWKHLKKYLETQEGLTDVPGSPNGVFKKAFVAHVIEDAEPWIYFNQQRCATSHDYNQLKADEAFNVIARFLPEAIKLYERMSHQPW